MLGRFLLDLLRHALGGARPEEPTVPQVQPLDGLRCLVRGRHGWFLANRYDRYVGAALVRYGEYGELEHAFLASLLRPGDNVVEVGANIGSHTVGLARSVGPDGRVVAVEAQPEIFQVLCANLALNGLANVAAHGCGCGERPGTMYAPAVDYGRAEVHNAGGISLADTGNGARVSIVPLDELAGELPTLRLLKVDVEGMELKVLLGAARLIAKHRPCLYLENDRPDLSRDLVEWVQGQKYRLWWHAPRLFNPDNYFGVTENDYPEVMSLNMICLPAGTAVPAEVERLEEVTDPAMHPLRR
jgi:FkbM family methyltransferase